MRPPICAICDKRLEDMNDGGLIYFKKSPSDLEWDKKIKQKGWVGHPPYAEWFCKEHYKEAFKLKNLTKREAMELLNK